MLRASYPRAAFSRFLITSLFFAISALPLAANSWRVNDLSDTISVDTDGTTTVQERITVAFSGVYHGIHRMIPVEYPGPGGTNYTLFLHVTAVTDENGHNLKYDSTTSNGYRNLKIYIPGAVDTTRTVQITYRMRNAVRFFDDHDEFYWNVTGNDWPVPIDHASAFVTFPAAASGSLRAQAFTGTYGSAEHDATAEVNGANVTSETTSPLAMRGGLTIDVFINKDILKKPGSLTLAFWFIGSNPIVFLPLVTLAVMFGLWWKKGRDPNPGMSVAPMYEPPAGFTPAETGALLEDQVHPKDVTSTIVDMAVRGFIKIEQVDDKGLIFHHKDYVFHLLKPAEEWQGMAAHERLMMTSVFGSGTEPDVRLSSLKNRFYTSVPAIRQDIMAALRQKDMYSIDPDKASAYSVTAAVAIVLAFAALQYIGLANWFSSTPMLFFATALSAVIWWLFARQMTAKTTKGAQAQIAVLGFQEFMNRVDADRLKRMPTDTFEKYLPYAMALGVEHHWAQAFAGIITDPPSWYTAPGPYTGFNPIFFSSSMHSMATDMHQVFVSAPRASSSGSGWGGGGSGGGFSGGGFGGGGGGAF